MSLVCCSVENCQYVNTWTILWDFIWTIETELKIKLRLYRSNWNFKSYTSFKLKSETNIQTVQNQVYQICKVTLKLINYRLCLVWWLYVCICIVRYKTCALGYMILFCGVFYIVPIPALDYFRWIFICELSIILIRFMYLHVTVFSVCFF